MVKEYVPAASVSPLKMAYGGAAPAGPVTVKVADAIKAFTGSGPIVVDRYALNCCGAPKALNPRLALMLAPTIALGRLKDCVATALAAVSFKEYPHNRPLLFDAEMLSQTIGVGAFAH